MTSDAATAQIVQIAKDYIELVRHIDPTWRRAWLRCQVDVGFAEAKGSYANASTVELIDVIGHKAFFHPVSPHARTLLLELGHTRGVLLLTVDRDFDYNIDFEYENLSRWRIGKLCGGDGIPTGLQ